MPNSITIGAGVRDPKKWKFRNSVIQTPHSKVAPEVPELWGFYLRVLVPSEFLAQQNYALDAYTFSMCKNVTDLLHRHAEFGSAGASPLPTRGTSSMFLPTGCQQPVKTSQ